MIEDFNETGMDMFSLAGRVSLVGGTGYAAYKTFSDFRGPLNKPVNPSNPSFQKQFGRVRDIPLQGGRETPRFQSVMAPFQDVLGDTRGLYQKNRLRFQKTNSTLFSNLGSGYKGRSAQLSSELSAFYGELGQMGFNDLNILQKTVDGQVGQIRIGGVFDGRKYYFDINPVSSTGAVYTGQNLQNQMAARSVVGSFDIAQDVSQSAIDIVGQDVALVRKYRESLGKIAQGVVDPRDLSQTILGASIYEGERFTAGKQSATTLSEIRREQAMIDPFNEMGLFGKQAVMKDLTRVKGFGAGSAGQFAAGILSTPDSLLNTSMPGMGVSGTSYQLLRENQFVGAQQPSVDYFKGMQTGIGEFTYAQIEDEEQFKRVMKQMYPSVGEVAAEEVLLNENRQVGVKNRLYTAKVDLDGYASKTMTDIIDQVSAQTGMTAKELAEAMSKPGGLAANADISKLNVDIAKGYNELLEKEWLAKEYLRNLDEVDPTRKAQAIDDLKNIRKEMEAFEVLGIAEDMSSGQKLPGKNLQQQIVNMTIDQNNRMSIALESHYKTGVGSKFFGAAKVVGKAEVDPAMILGQMEFEKAGGTGLASKARLQELGIYQMFEDIDMIGMEAAVKTKDGTLEARRVPDAISSYFSTNIANQRLSQEDLARFGIERVGDRYSYGGSSNFRDVISQIEEFEGRPIGDIVKGDRRGLSGVNISRLNLSPDVQAVQAGIGKTGTITERGAFYLESMGLEATVDDIYSRAARATDPSAQISILDRALTAEKNAKGLVGAESVIANNEMGSLFSTSLDTRRDTIARLTDGHDIAYVQLGKSVKGMDRVPVFSQEALKPFIGEGIGTEGGLTKFDRATRSLIEASVDTSEGADARLYQRAKEYESALGEVQGTIAKSIPKTNVSASMYGQFTSSIGDLTDITRETGIDTVAMTESDIRRKFGADALKRARSGDFFGFVTREPIEGSSSIIPTNIRVAEDVVQDAAQLGDMEGRIFLPESDRLRKGLMVDFDKDTGNIIGIMSENATQEIRQFMGAGAQQTEMGREYYNSLERMSLLGDLKSGKSAVDVMKETDDMLLRIAGEQKALEKSAIGVVSNTFKDVHIGLRESLAAGGGKAAKSFFLAEDFSHLFAENILKAKHQGKDIINNVAMEALDVMHARNKYASASVEARAGKMQEIFTQLAGNIEGKEKMAAFAEVTSMDNLSNVIKAKDRGAQIADTGDYLYKSMTAGLESKSGIGGYIDDAIVMSKQIAQRGLSNFGKYAILPTAAIGFVGSLVSKPKILTPTASTGPQHENTDGARTPEKVGHKGTIFAIPETNNTSFTVQGVADAETNMRSISSMSGQGGRVNVTDYRSKPDKFRLQEAIDKGY
jgi:hypothetical protein